MVGVNPQTKPGRPCEQCAWPYPGFHVCIDKSDPKSQKVILSPTQKAANRVNRYSGSLSAENRVRRHSDNVSAETRARLRDAANARWASHHVANSSRNAEMTRLYRDENFTVRDLERQFSLAHHTVLSVLHKARDEGLLVMRPSNFTK